MRHNIIGSLLLAMVVFALVVIIILDRFVWDFLDTATEYLILGGLVGFIINLIVGLFFSYDQFVSSTASQRVKKTIKATKEFFNKSEEYSGPRRNRYRYSLGVIIDELEPTFGKIDDFEKIKDWPCLTGYDPDNHQFSEDRWDRFNEYVRPVVEDINNSSFIGSYGLIRLFCKNIRQLSALTELCSCLENVVCEIDAAIQAKLIKLDNNNRVVPQSPVNFESESIKPLKNEYRHLHTAWCEWLRVTGIH